MDVSDKVRNQLAFFGITPESAPQVREGIYTQIHEIVFHGNGGYDWNTVYNMPIYLRRFTFNKIQEYFNKQNESTNQSSNGTSTTLMDSSGNINKSEAAKLKQTPPTKKVSYQ
jgi:hypothetical protein